MSHKYEAPIFSYDSKTEIFENLKFILKNVSGTRNSELCVSFPRNQKKWSKKLYLEYWS